MKKKDIPQQPHQIYEGETKAIYAVNEDGKLEIGQSSGWEVESIVLEQAIEEINRLSTEALKRIRKGRASTLEYHMYIQRMDLPMLAKATNYSQWRVKRHMKPKGFSKLNKEQLSLYAEVLGIDVESLKQIPHD